MGEVKEVQIYMKQAAWPFCINQCFAKLIHPRSASWVDSCPRSNGREIQHDGFQFSVGLNEWMFVCGAQTSNECLSTLLSEVVRAQPSRGEFPKPRSRSEAEEEDNCQTH